MYTILYVLAVGDSRETYRTRFNSLLSVKGVQLLFLAFINLYFSLKEENDYR